MTTAVAAPTTEPRPLPAWLPWTFLMLLVLPMHPMWVDFEQVRRGILLVLAGSCLIALPRLPHVRGERMVLAFVGFLIACGIVNLLGQVLLRDPDQPLSFQWWDAADRVLYWLSLWVVLRLGAATGGTAGSDFAWPMTLVLLATSLFGLLQRLGIAEWQGYGVEREPVSMLGNLNVASEWTTVAACVVAVLLPGVGDARRRALMWATLAAAGAYLVVDQSRSGLIALPIALLLLGLLRRKLVALLPLAVVLGGGAAGLVVQAAKPLPQPADTIAAIHEQKRSTVTLEVRKEIYKGTSHLLAESPVFGHGPGQFAVQYPRVRSQQEIELSSNHRQFASEVRTAHDDWLELLVDGGIPGFVLFALMLFALQRAQKEKGRLLPLFALLLLMLVRSPLGNAPAAVAALWLVASPMTALPARRWQRPAAIGLGVLMLVFGVLPIAGNTLFAPYQSARARGQTPPQSALTDAAFCMPYEPRWLSLLAQEQLIAAERAEKSGNQQAFAEHVDLASKYAARAVQLRPFDPELYQWLIEALAKARKFPEAIKLANHALKLDAANPELRVALSATLAQQGQTDAAIAAVVYDPHPRLRAELTRHFADLTAVAKARGDKPAAARFAVEHHFLAAVDGLGNHEPAVLVDTEGHVKQMMQSMIEAKQPPDVRALAVTALNYIDLGLPDRAIQLSERASKVTVPLQGWQRQLFGDQLQRLDPFGTWHQVLGAGH